MSPQDHLASENRFKIVFCAVMTLYVVPVAFFAFLPSQDAPNHFAIIATLANAGSDAQWDELFASRLTLAPYAGIYLLGVGLAKVLGAVMACRAILLLYVIALPCAALALLRAIDSRPPWAALSAFPLLYNDCYLVGFLPYLLTLPMILFASSLAIRLARRERPSVVLAAGLSALGVLAHLAHPLGAALLIVCCVCVGVSYSSRLSRFLVLAAALVPALALVILFAGGHGATTDNSYLPTAFKLSYFVRTPIFGIDAMRFGVWLWITLAFLAAGAVALIVRSKSSWHAPTWAIVSNRLTRRSLWWTTLVLTVLYFVLPFRSGSTIWLDLRVAPLAWIFAAVVAARALSSRRAHIGLAALVVLVGLANLDLHRRFSEEAAPIAELVDRMEPRKKVVSINLDATSETLSPFYQRDDVIPYFSPFAHVASYYHVRKGGVSPFLTFEASLPWIPLELRPQPYLDGLGIADVFDGFRIVASLGAKAEHFDYIILRGVNATAIRVIERHARLVSRHGTFALYQVLHSQPAR